MPEGEADEIDRARQRGGGDRLVAEAPDEGEIGRHHRDLPELGQRHRHRQPQRLGKLIGELAMRFARTAGGSLDFVEGGHEAISTLPVENVAGQRETGAGLLSAPFRHARDLRA